MKIKLDKNAFIPTRAHSIDGGLDLYCPKGQGQIVSAKESAVFDTGVHVEIPVGMVGKIESRSGLSINHDILSSPGVIDAGYIGSIRVKLYNLSGYDYEVKEGDKISQLVIYPILTPELELVDELDETERGIGGFGSTGR